VKERGGIYTDLGQITAITEVKLQRINLIFRNFTNIVDMHKERSSRKKRMFRTSERNRTSGRGNTCVA
jgi:hypothetical protein